MPSWTLSELMSNATKRVGYRAELSASEVSFWVNQAYQDFVRDIPELLSEKTHYFSTVSGTSFVALPADFYFPIVISHQTTTAGSGRTLLQTSPEWADSQGYYPVGEPSHYFIYNDQICLWPSANSSAATTDASSGRSYLLRYRAIPSDLTSTSAVPSVATEHRIAILFKTEQYLHDLLGNVDDSIASHTQYFTFVSSLKDSMAKRQRARGPVGLGLSTHRRRNFGRSPRDDDSWYRR